MDGLMSWGANMDVWKFESMASMSQLQSSLNDMIAMHKALVEKLGVQGSTQGVGLPIKSRLNIENHNHDN
jgi:hypothetical protein